MNSTILKSRKLSFYAPLIPVVALLLLFYGCEEKYSLMDRAVVENPDYYKYSSVNCNTGDSIVNESEMEGYSDKQSYFPGEEAIFFTHCRTTRFDVDFYACASTLKKVYEIRGISGRVQNYSCYSYSYGCKWKESFRFTIPDHWASGMYSARLMNENGRDFWVTFIVKKPRNALPNKIAVLASTNTWQAYNYWGGASFYNTVVEDDYPTSENVSFYRPNLMASPTAQATKNHLASAERFMHGWLEDNNYAYDAYCDRDLHDSPTLLSGYRVLILHVHPEYWSQTMRDNLVHFLNQGGNLMYLGGNGVYWKVVYNVELNVLEVRRNLDIHYYIPTPGGQWSQLSQPMDALLGVEYDSRGFNTGAPYKVHDPDHWIFKGTGLKKGDLFGQNCMSCNGGASGHETDKVGPDSPPLDTLAIGTNANEGGAWMVYYQNPSGGQVFSVGSIDYTHALPVDSAVSRITQNVLERFIQ
ncbi:hypothetical protein KFE98_13610 [bacterium SCSIO 12741]|nr:hypothetical protein KFE98_13610 [bacterium SCSIO 12741]